MESEGGESVAPRHNLAHALEFEEKKTPRSKEP
jgi:hypothetical protein